jgi:putative cell wall-binding protein
MLAASVVAPLSLTVAVPYEVSDLESSTHPSETTWYSDDSLELDWASAPAPGVLSSADTTGRAYGAAVAGDYAYVADGETGLAVVDISELGTPTVLASADTSGTARRVDVCGDHAFVADRSGGLQVVDVSEPGTPTVVGWTATPDSAWAVAVEGQYAYIADGSSVQVADVSNPASPSLVGSHTVSGSAFSVEVDGDVLYATQATGGLGVYDISDPTSPTPLGSTASRADRVAVDGTHAFVARNDTGGDNAVDVVDVSDPTAPTVIGSVNLDDDGLSTFSASDLDVSGDYVYVSCSGGGPITSKDFQLVDVTDPTDPVLVDIVDVNSNSYSLTAFDGHALVAADREGLVAVELWELGVPERIGTFDTDGTAYALDVCGDLAYIADSGTRLTIADISDPTAPTLVGRIDQNFAARDIEVRSGYAYIAASGGGLEVHDVSDPTSPFVAASFDTTVNAFGIDVQGDIACIADTTGGLEVFDITTPTVPAYLGGTATGDSANKVDVCGSYAYIADRNSGLSVVNMSDPSAPFLMDSQPLPLAAQAESVVVCGDVAYVGGFNSVHAIDVSDPKKLVLLDSLTVSGTAFGLDVAGDVLMAAVEVNDFADVPGWLYVIDVTDPSDLTTLETHGTRRAGWDVEIAGDVAYVSNDRVSTGRENSGLDVFSWGGPVGYSYVLDADDMVVPDASVDVTPPTVQLSNVPDGEWWFTVQAISRSGDVGQTLQRKIKVDTTPPTTTSDTQSEYEDSATITLSATDVHSGPDTTYYTLDGGAKTEYTAPIEVTESGEHTLVFWSIDVAGNEEAKQTDTFEIVAAIGPYNPVEIAGATRYETAIEASKEAFPNGLSPDSEGRKTVVVATGENWPDALGGAALAGAYDGPILLTPAAALPASVMDEIRRLGATEAFILGGTGAVSPAVETQLAAELGAAKVVRVGGSDRYVTAELIARAVATAADSTFDGTAFVATGLNFPDALAGSPLAAAGDWPILLAPETGMRASTIAAMNDIGVDEVLILGGTGVVSQTIEDGFAAALGAGNVTRLAGATRYETAIAVATHGVDEAGLAWDMLALATGENFPDALAGGVLQGQSGSVMLLTLSSSLTPSTAATLTQQKDLIGTVRFLGGTGAVSQTVRDQVGQILQ